MDARKELTLYQVGDVVIKIAQETWHGYGNQAKVSVERVLYSNDYVFSNAPRVVEPRTITVTGILLSTTYTMQEYVGLFNSLINTITDLIAYQLIDCCHDNGCCGCSNDWQDVMWWQNIGLIKDIALSQDKSGAMQIAITFIMQAAWQPVNRFIWSWARQKRNFWSTETPNENPTFMYNNLSESYDVAFSDTYGSFGTDSVSIQRWAGFYFQATSNSNLKSITITIRIGVGFPVGNVIWRVVDINQNNFHLPHSIVRASGVFSPNINGTNTIDIQPNVSLGSGVFYALELEAQTVQPINTMYHIASSSTLFTSIQPSYYMLGGAYGTGFLWEYNQFVGRSIASIVVGSGFINEMRPYPTIDDILSNCDALWIRRNWSSTTLLYNPSLWEILHQHHRSGYPATGFGTNYSIGQTVKTYAISPKRGLFSCEPTSLYYFTNLSATSGNILISIKRFKSNIWQATREDTSIDLSALNVDLAANGYTGLLATDTLIIGDTPNRPGFIIRNNVIISSVSPTVFYPGNFPGEIGPDKNQITFLMSPTFQYAQLHTYRRL